MMIILPTDKVFYDSPDAGDRKCLCSRCGYQIPEEESPFLRVWPSEPGDIGFDKNAPGGTEFRFCWACSKKMGLNFNP